MRYVKWRKPKGGVKKDNGDRRRCMHCNKLATHIAVKRNHKFRMDVWLCEAHMKRRKSGE